MTAATTVTTTTTTTKTAASTTPALVQILIYGLSAFDLSRYNPPLKMVTVYMPQLKTPYPEHTVKIYQGQQPGGAKPQWVELHPPTGHSLKNISFPALDGGIEIHDDQAVSGHPSTDPEDGSGVKWLLGYHDLEAQKSLPDFSLADVRLYLTGGTLETCGLVHDNDTLTSVCAVEAGNLANPRAASEYMVVRQEVPLATTELVLDLGNNKSLKVKPMTSTSVHWRGTNYSKVFNVMIVNLHSTNQRLMQTDHLMYLKGFFHTPDPVKNWYISSPATPGCKDPLTSLQPSCWIYFSEFKDFPSGPQHEICPLVGYP